MCGICGAVWTDAAKDINSRTLDVMTDILRHRGPDDRGTFRQTIDEEHFCGVALGHRRLSILDLSPKGRQPMSNEDGTVFLVFNGEIYNYEPLRNELIQKGHRFKSHTDTEVLIHLYEEYGVDFVQKVNGMFAVAVWDSVRKQVILFRDRIGKKPLCYRKEPGRLLFASELKSILTVPGIPKELDLSALDDYLTYQYVPHPKTIFQGIRKLPPAHFAVWDCLTDSFSVQKYWSISEISTTVKPFADCCDELRALVFDAVKIRLHSDVPVGAFLSGGIDSSITAGVMQQIQREYGQTVRTFSIGFAQQEYDETRYARQAAASFGTKHQEFFVTPDVEDLLPKLVWHYDEPFADSSAVPTFYLCEMTRREVTVALSGDGGDEMFAGYDRYRAVQFGQWVNKLPVFVRKCLANLRHLIPASTKQRSTVRRLKRFLEAAGMEPLEQYLQWIAVFNNERRQSLYRNDFAQQLAGNDPLDFLRSSFRSGNDAADFVRQITFIDQQTYLPCDLMTKADIASMAHSLECRAPLLDYRIAEWSAALPMEYKLSNLTPLTSHLAPPFIGGRFRGKLILREAFKDLLPPDIEKRRKMGFGVPIDHWFRGPLKKFVKEILLDKQTLQRGFFVQEYIEQLLNEHFENRFDHAYRIWSLLILELWLRQWFDSTISPAGCPSSGSSE